MSQAPVITGIFVFLVGAAVGSFLNVVITRLPLEESLVRPRSRCPRCKHPIRWHDNIPLLGYLLLLGRCRDCRERISWRYPLVEALTALLALGLWWRFGLSTELAIHFVFSAALIAVAFIDIDYQIIPNELSLPGIVLAVAASFLLPGFWKDSLIGLAVGGGLTLGFSLLYGLIRGQAGMGMGDVKLMALIGAWLGWRSLLFVLLFSSVQGVVVSVGLWLAGVQLREPLPEEEDEETPHSGEIPAGEGPRAEPMKPSEAPPAKSFGQAAIPFGCFLALAAIEYLFLGSWFMSWLHP